MPTLFALSDSNHQIHHFDQSTLNVFSRGNYFFIRVMNEHFGLYEAHRLFATSSNTFKSSFKRVSALFVSWMNGLFDFGRGPWQQSEMFSARWDHWCDGKLSSWIFQCRLCERLCAIPSTPNTLQRVSGTNRVALRFICFLVAILFAWPASDSSLPQTCRKW